MITKLSKEETLYVLTTNYIARIAYIADSQPYIVPVTYFYDRKNNAIISYSGEGHKLEAMRQNPNVCLECEELEHIKSWKTVVAHGQFEELSGSDAKQAMHSLREGVVQLMKARGRNASIIEDFSSAVSNENLRQVYRIRLGDISGRKQ